MKRVASIHRYELACRLIEAVFDLQRPPDAEPKVLIEELNDDNGDMGARWVAAADAAIWYMNECTIGAKGEKHKTDWKQNDARSWHHTSDTTH